MNEWKYIHIFRNCLDGANSGNIEIEFYSRVISYAHNLRSKTVYFQEILKIYLTVADLQIQVFQHVKL
jgi:hypothetical protein